ncbi:MAG: fibronectin type III domain-containing protein [Deltaproteobacteria bacterium]|nr:fibronectin type III domain-containing protein [Deltaproteobacteria bacterium]MBW1922011.1 fibronectin type III domain-containing protein [Deltaproteobacteria bacterium]MBW2346705.1 fibronectin type III domain-containing protein [Deltaproteobacteria bacterium]
MKTKCEPLWFTISVLWMVTFLAGPSVAACGMHDLPVLVPDLPERQVGIRNRVVLDQIRSIRGPDREGRGLVMDLGDPSLFGTIYTGPYPFEVGLSDYDHFRFRMASPLRQGRGVLEIRSLLMEKFDANNWLRGPNDAVVGTIGYRLDLWRMMERGLPRHLGFYDGVAGFRVERDGFLRAPAVTEEPFVCLVTSDDPRTVVVAWETDASTSGLVRVREGADDKEPRVFSDHREGTRHRVILRGLRAGRRYAYRVEGRDREGRRVSTRFHRFKTAPLSGQGSVRFAYAGDGRLDRYGADPGFRYPTWHITAGTAGAPYYSREEDTLWRPVIFSSQEGYVLVETQGGKVSLRFMTLTGRVVDRVEDLMRVKGLGSGG